MAVKPTIRSNGHTDGRRDVQGHSKDRKDRDASHDSKIRGTTIEEVYDRYADTYEHGAEETRLRSFQREIFQRFPHHGFTLDLGCGTGAVGKLIRQSPLNSDPANNIVDQGAASYRLNVYVHGVDVSTRMLNSSWCVWDYDSREKGLIQDVLTDPNAAWVQRAVQNGAPNRPSSSGALVDHITCFGALHFLDHAQFEDAMARMFLLARCSVTFDVDDLSPEYMQYVLEKVGKGFRNYNHVAAYRELVTPPGWAKVVEEEAVLYHSENVGVDVWGILVRFERVN